ncbi:MAG: thioredoxin family protein [Tannerellaceae bacterium]|nr:thioredoxin family protein [Tannerellaceae bacterium]
MRTIFSIILGGFILFQANGQIFDPVRWNITAEEAGHGEIVLLFTAAIDRGWHVYGLDLPAGGPVPTSVTFETLQGAAAVGKPAATPEANLHFDDMFNMEVGLHSGAVTFRQKLRITNPGAFRIAGEIEYMACDDERCLPPAREAFSFDNTHFPRMAMGGSGEAFVDSAPPASDSGAAVEDASASPQALPVTVKPVALPAHHSPAEADTWKPVISELRELGDEGLQAADSSLLHIFLAGLAGGAIALLTPCVWPMVPMTVSFFLKRSGSRRRAVRDALLFGASIIIIYVGMGLAITLALGANALNDMATNMLNVVFGLLLTVFAASFLGAFELTLPSSWTTKMDRRADGATGWLSMFFMAFTLALVSFSCTGPIIGTLLVQAATMGGIGKPAMGMLGFSAALAAPFALFALFPDMLQKMPKSGGWMNVVKVTLGFLELALALKFFSVADLAYGWGLLDREVFLSLWIVIFVLLGMYLLGKLRLGHDECVKPVGAFRLFTAIASLAFAAYMAPGLWGAPLKAISAFSPPLYTQDFNLFENEVHAAFDDYDSGMAKARAVRKPVAVDFSGFGCVNCRRMEASVWTDPQVKDLLEKEYILITLFVDDKTRLPEPVKVVENGRERVLRTVGDKWSYLQRSKFGANAQPFYVLLNAEGDPLAPSYAFSDNVAAFRSFLIGGLNIYKSQQQ